MPLDIGIYVTAAAFGIAFTVTILIGIVVAKLRDRFRR